MTLPLEKSYELIQRINEMLNSPVYNEIELKQIENQAQALMKTDAASAHLVLGMVYAIKNNETKSRYHHELALQLGCDLYLGNSNFAVSLSKIGYGSEALKYARDAYRSEKSSETISDLIEYSYTSLQFEESLRYFFELENLGAKFSKELPSKSVLEEITSFMRKYALTDSDLLNISCVVENIIRDNQVKLKRLSVDLYVENEDEWLSIGLFVKSSPKEVSEFNFSLADRFSELDLESVLLDKISYRFISGSENTKICDAAN